MDKHHWNQVPGCIASAIRQQLTNQGGRGNRRKGRIKSRSLSPPLAEKSPRNVSCFLLPCPQISLPRDFPGPCRFAVHYQPPAWGGSERDGVATMHEADARHDVTKGGIPRTRYGGTWRSRGEHRSPPSTAGRCISMESLVRPGVLRRSGSAITGLSDG